LPEPWILIIFGECVLQNPRIIAFYRLDLDLQKTTLIYEMKVSLEKRTANPPYQKYTFYVKHVEKFSYNKKDNHVPAKYTLFRSIRPSTVLIAQLFSVKQVTSNNSFYYTVSRDFIRVT